MTAETDHADARAKGAQIAYLGVQIRKAGKRLAKINFALTRGHDPQLAQEVEMLTAQIADLEAKLKMLKREAAVTMHLLTGGQGWALTGQHVVPASTEIDLTKDPKDFTVWEQLAVGKTPPLDAVSLDYDSALALWVRYPDHRHLPRRSLDAWNQEQFEKFLGMGDAMLHRYWSKP